MAVESRAEAVRLGEPGWLEPLLAEAVAAPTMAFPRVPVKLSEADIEVQEPLWTTGALMGIPWGGQPSPVTGSSATEQAYVELLRFELALLAALGRAFAPDGNAKALLMRTVAALLAASAGELAAATRLWAAEGKTEGLSERDQRRVLGAIGSRVARNAYLRGNPSGGLPLHALLAALDARHVVRLALGQLLRQGTLARRAERYLARHSRLKALAIELVASVVGAAGASGRHVVLQQAREAGLLPADRRSLGHRLASPRPPLELLRPVPGPLRRLLLEQLALTAMLEGSLAEALQAKVTATALDVGIAPNEWEATKARAAAFVLAHGAQVSSLAAPSAPHVARATLTGMVDAFTEAAEDVAREIENMGELGVLLARMADGETLSAAEKREVRTGLIDLAKIVPSLAVFAAPGGTLLLPLLIKVLPFDLRPSAFRHA